MVLNSMTGFARADGANESVRWFWEVRSVNGRGLDVRVRLPQGYESLEPKVREAAAKRFARGSLTLNLNAQRETPTVEVRVQKSHRFPLGRIDHNFCDSNGLSMSKGLTL